MIDEEIPLLRTFRAELAKRSSMLVDEDMKEYFTQQFDGPTASRANYDTQSAVYKSSMQTKAESSMTAELAEVTKVVKVQPQQSPVTAEQARVSETSNRGANLSELSMTLKAMESSSTLLNTSSVSTASSMMAGPRVQRKPHQQTVITTSIETICPRGQVLNVTAILNPQTSKRVTLVEALNTGLLDPKTKTFVDPSTRQRLPLTQATKKGYVDEVLLKQLTSPCGLHDPQSGQEMCLIDAIQRKLYDPNSNTFVDPTTSEQISVNEAVSRSVIIESCSNLLAGEGVRVSSTSHTQALFANSEPLRVDTALSIGKVVEKGLYSDITGKVIDPLSGAYMSIMEAVEKGYISPNHEEIQDPTTGDFVTLTDAVTSGIIDPFKGTLNSKSTGQKLPLSTAMNKGLVKSATCLAEMVNAGCLTEDGKVYDPLSGQVLNFTDALEKGVISKHKKCIMDPATDKVLSVQEAIVQGVIAPTGMFVDPNTKARVPILDALKQGIVKLVHEDVEFSRTGVKDPRTNEVITLSEALARGIVTSQGTYKDNRTGREMSLQQAANSGLMDRQLVKDLSKPTSLQTAEGKNISIAEALSRGMLDPETGSVENARTNENLSMQEALSNGVISGTDVTNILSLISPMMKSTTVLSQVESTVLSEESLTVPQAVSQGLLDKRSETFTDPRTNQTMSVQDAIQRGLLKPSSEWSEPASITAGFDQADSVTMSKTFMAETFMTDSTGEKTRTIPIEPGSKQIESSYISKTDSHYSFTTTSVAKPLIMPSVINETREINLKSVVDTRSGRELDVDDAIKRHLVDLEKGQYTNPVTGETMSLHQAIQAGFIKAENTEGSLKGGVAVKETRAFSIVGVIDPQSKDRLPVSDAISKGILDQGKGLYYGTDGFGRSKPMKISEAIEKGLVIVEDIGDVNVDPNAMLRETKSYILKAVVHPVTKQHMNIADAVSEGIIDESVGLYVNPRTGEKIPIDEAIDKGLIYAKLATVKTDVNSDVNKITTTKAATLAITAVVDPRNNEIISVSKAIKEGILDNSKGIYTNPQTGESMTVGDAIDKKLVLAESPEAQSNDPLEKAEISSIHITEEEQPFESTLMEDIHSETVTMSITSVIDPRTMDMVPYDKAVELGILNVKKGTYNDRTNGESMTIAAAMEKGLIHGEVTSKRVDDDTLRSAVSAATPAVPFKDITSVIDPRTRKPISFDKALKDGIINLDKGTYYNPVTKTEIRLDKAHEFGYLLASKHSDSAQIERSLEEETMLEAKLSTPRIPKDSNQPWSKVDMELEKTFAQDESMNDSSPAREILHYSTEVENGAAADAKPKIPPPTLPKSQVGKSAPLKAPEGMSYTNAVKLGLVNEDTGRVRDPRSGVMLTLQEAIDRGVIDPDQEALEEPSSGRRLSLNDCLARNIIDPISCKVNETKAKVSGYSERAIPQNSENIQSMNIIDAVEAGLYNQVTHKFLEPKAGEEYSLQEGLNCGVIEGTMVTVKDTATSEKLPLQQAVKSGLINGGTSAVYDTAQHTTVPLPLAIEKSLVEHRYDTDTGCVIDGQTGEAIPLRKAIADGDLNAKAVFVLDTERGEQVPMDEALHRGLVDRTGSVIDKDSGKKMSPTEALKFGLLAIAGAPIAAGILVADALKDKKDSRSKTSSSPTRQRSGHDSFERSATSDLKQSFESQSQSLFSREETFTKSVASRKSSQEILSGSVKEGPSSPVQTEPLSFNNNRIKTPKAEARDSMDDEVSSPLGQKTFEMKPSTPYTPITPFTPSAASRGISEETTLLQQEVTETKILKQERMKNLDINWESGTVLDKSSGKEMTVTQAVQQGLIDSDYVEDLAESTTGHLQTPPPEIHINWDDGSILDERTGETFTIERAVQKGLIDSPTANALAAVAETNSILSAADPQHKAKTPGDPYTLNDAIKEHCPRSGQIVDPISGKNMTVHEALRRNVIDGNESVVIDPETGREMSLQTAIDFRIFDPVKGELVHKGSGERISMQEATIQGLIPEIPLSGMQQKADHSRPSLTLHEAIGRGLVDRENRTFTDPLSGEIMPVTEALEYGLISSPDETDSARRGLISSPDETDSLRRSPQKALKESSPVDGQRFALLDAIHDQILDTSSPAEPRTNQGVGLTKAVEDGLFDERNGNFTDPDSGDRLTFQDALETGKLDPNFTVVEVKSGEIYSLEEGINEGKIDPRTGKYIDEETGKKMSISEAAKIGALAIVGAPAVAALSAKEAISSLIDKKPKEKRAVQAVEDPNLSFHVTTVKRISPEVLEVTDVQQSIPAVDASDSMTLFEAIASGYLNPTTGVFKDPNTGDEMQASDAVMSGLIQKDSATVKDPDTGRLMNLEDSLRHGVLDDSGQNVDPRTGKLKPLDQLIKDGTVQEAPASVSKDVVNVFSKSTEKIKVDTVYDPASNEEISLDRALDRGIIHLDDSTYENPVTGETMTLEEAVKEGFIHGVVFDKTITTEETSKGGLLQGRETSSGERLHTRETFEKSKNMQEQTCEIHSVYDPYKEEHVSVTEAISTGLLDMKSGVYYNPLTDETIPVQHAQREGLIQGAMKDKLAPGSVRVGDFKIKSAVDTERNQVLSGKDAAQEGIIDPKRACFVDTESGKTMSILEALKEGLVTLESDVPDPVVTSVSQKSMTITAVVDPVSGEEMTMSEAIGQGVFDADKGEVVNRATGEHISLDDAISKGLISADVEEGEDAQEVAVINGVLITGAKDPVSGEPISITDAIDRGILDKENGLYKTMHGDITLRDALKRDYIEGKDTTEEGGLSDQKKQDAKQIQVTKVFDPMSGHHVGLEEAIENELVDVNCTVYHNPVTGVEMLMEDAMKEGLVAGTIQTISKSETSVTSKKPLGTYNITGVLDTETGNELSVEEAISKGILDPSGTYRDTFTGDEISLPEAIKLGFVVSEKVERSPTGSIVAEERDRDNVVTFRDALRRGLIDPNSGTFLDEASQKTYSVDEAVRTGLVVASDGRPFEYKGVSETGVTYSFKNALMTGIIDSENGLFYDSITGDTVSIEAALEEGYLSPIAGAYGGRAVGDSLVMLNGGVAPNSSSNLEEILDSKTGEKLSLDEAERRGLVSVVGTNRKMTLDEAIQSGLVDKDSGIFHDPASGQTMPVDQAILCDVLTYDDHSKGLAPRHQSINGTDSITLASAISQGYIDSASATFTDPHSNETVSVSQAVQKGFLKPVLTVGDSLDTSTGKSSAMEGPRDIVQGIKKPSRSTPLSVEPFSNLEDTTEFAPASHHTASIDGPAASTPRQMFREPEAPRVNGDGPGYHGIQPTTAAKTFSAADQFSPVSRASTSTPVNFVSSLVSFVFFILCTFVN